MSLSIQGSSGAGAGILFPDGTTQPSAARFGQTVSVAINARYALSNSSFGGIGPTISITPSSTSSKILIQATLSIQYQAYSYLTFLRNGTNVSNARGITTYNAASSWTNAVLRYVDSPSSTSSVTYQLGVWGNIYLNDYSAGNYSQIILTEILP
jgi:hypothetical protein